MFLPFFTFSSFYNKIPSWLKIFLSLLEPWTGSIKFTRPCKLLMGVLLFYIPCLFKPNDAILIKFFFSECADIAQTMTVYL